MSNNFSRTLRALRADGLTGWTVRALLAALLLAVWASWFFLGRITLWAVSDSALAEVRDQVSSVDAPVDGRVVEVHIKTGQRVTEGSILVELEALQEEGRREALVAELEGEYARRDELQNRITNERQARDLWLSASESRANEALARVQEAESAAELAAREEARARGLFEQNLIPQGELDRAVSEREQKEAQADSARAAARRVQTEREVERAERNGKIENLKGQLQVLSNDLRAEETKIANLEQEVGMRQIRAPASGILARVAPLRPGSMVTAGEEIARIVPSGQIGVAAKYEPADAVGRVRPGQSARLRLDAFPSTQFGTIPATVVVVDSEPTEGLIRVYLDLDETQPTNIVLEHGMPGRVEVEVDRVSPASLLMRAVGKLLDQSASDRSASLSGAGSAD